MFFSHEKLILVTRFVTYILYLYMFYTINVSLMGLCHFIIRFKPLQHILFPPSNNTMFIQYKTMQSTFFCTVINLLYNNFFKFFYVVPLTIQLQDITFINS